jgi:hypothetical protein
MQHVQRAELILVELGGACEIHPSDHSTVNGRWRARAKSVVVFIEVRHVVATPHVGLYRLSTQCGQSLSTYVIQNSLQTPIMRWIATTPTTLVDQADHYRARSADLRQQEAEWDLPLAADTREARLALAADTRGADIQVPERDPGLLLEAARPGGQLGRAVAPWVGLELGAAEQAELA